MKCSKCGKELEKGSNFCNGCGSRIDRTIEEDNKMPSSEEGRAMRSIYERKGSEVFDKPELLINALNDLLADSKKIRNLLRIAFDAGIGLHYKKELEKEKTTFDFYEKVSKIIMDAGLNEESAWSIISWLEEMLGWGRLEALSDLWEPDYLDEFNDFEDFDDEPEKAITIEKPVLKDGDKVIGDEQGKETEPEMPILKDGNKVVAVMRKGASTNKEDISVDIPISEARKEYIAKVQFSGKEHVVVCPPYQLYPESDYFCEINGKKYMFRLKVDAVSPIAKSIFYIIGAIIFFLFWGYNLEKLGIALSSIIGFIVTSILLKMVFVILEKIGVALSKGYPEEARKKHEMINK